MSNIFKQNSYDVIIIIGNPSNIEELLQIRSKRIILVESSFSKFLENMQKYEHISRVEHYNLVIGAEEKTVIYSEYNIDKANNFKTPTGMLELFPRLRSTSKKEVNIVDASSFIESLLLQGIDNLLVISSFGNENDILARLDAKNCLKLFSDYIVYSSHLELYVGSKQCIDMIQLLNGNHCNLLHADASEDREIPCFYIQRNKLEHENKKLQAIVSDCEQKLSVITESLEAKATKITLLEQEQSQCLDQLNAKNIELNIVNNDLRGIREQLNLSNETSDILVLRFEQTKIEFLEQVEQQKKLIIEKNKALAELKSKNGELLVEQRNSKVIIARMEDEIDRYEKTTNLLHTEVKKAESQINMIKDFMFSAKKLG